MSMEDSALVGIQECVIASGGSAHAYFYDGLAFHVPGAAATALKEKLTEFEARSGLSVKVRAFSASVGDCAFAVGQGSKRRRITRK